MKYSEIDKLSVDELKDLLNKEKKEYNTDYLKRYVSEEINKNVYGSKRKQIARIMTALSKKGIKHV